MDSACFIEGCSLEQLKNWYGREYGKSGMKALEERLGRAHNKGTSSQIDDSLEDTILCNRSGENESNLTNDEFINQFL